MPWRMRAYSGKRVWKAVAKRMRWRQHHSRVHRPSRPWVAIWTNSGLNSRISRASLGYQAKTMGSSRYHGSGTLPKSSGVSSSTSCPMARSSRTVASRVRAIPLSWGNQQSVEMAMRIAVA